MHAPLSDLGRIGLGCVTFGREIEEPAAFALMDHAWRRGVRFFDTAAAYGGGASERIVGRWLAARRAATLATPMVATKILPPFAPEQIETDAAASRQRLGVEALDVLFLHRWHPSLSADAVLESLDRLVHTGGVSALGLSNVTAAQLAPLLERQAARGLAPFRLVQNNHNLAVRDVDDELRELCARHGLTLTTYSPLGAGFLTGKHAHGAAPGTRFTLIPGHQAVYFHEPAFRRLAHLQAVAARTDHSPTHLALAWALHQPGVACVLVGGRTPAHLDQAFDALQLNDPALFAELSLG